MRALSINENNSLYLQQKDDTTFLLMRWQKLAWRLHSYKKTNKKMIFKLGQIYIFSQTFESEEVTALGL